MPGTTLMVYASGYPYPWASDAQEIAYARSNPSLWHPSSLDFQATARRSGSPSAAGSVADLLTIISSMAVGSIDRLGLIGHAGDPAPFVPRSFGFAGRVGTTAPWDVRITELLNATTLAAVASSTAALRNRFARDARIVLYACHTGADTALLDPISKAFGVCVDGFSEELWWCFEWMTPAMSIIPGTRGKVFFDSLKLSVIHGPMTCWGYADDATKLKPDLQSCAGVAAPSAPGARRPGAR